MSITPFQQRVYDIVRQIPTGYVMTYKQVGEKLGSRAYQAIGQALRKNPFAPEVPCHRVVASDFTLGGFRGERDGQAILDKREMLINEGVDVERLWDFATVL